MSVLIKGLEMPKNGYECPLCRDGMCLFPRKDSDGICLSFGPYEEERPVDCPLIEVPTPHGRLIDADALANDGWTLHKQVMIMGGFAIHELPLKNPTIPTVIEAEGGET